MDIFYKIVEILDATMETPGLFGMFHILSLVVMVLAAIFFCRWCKDAPDRVRKLVLYVGIIVAVLELYKQVSYTFWCEDGVIKASYQWYAFPFQFCCTPLYVDILAGILGKGKVYRALLSYLATYGLFAGIAVMLYPGDVFTEFIGVNFETMICHGAMVVIGVVLLYTGEVKCKLRTLLGAASVFAVCLSIAVAMNEIAYRVGIVENHSFNMFFVSPYVDPSLPVYSLVQQVVPFPLSLVIYIAGFTAAAGIILVVGSKLFGRKAAAVSE